MIHYWSADNSYVLVREMVKTGTINHGTILPPHQPYRRFCFSLCK